MIYNPDLSYIHFPSHDIRPQGILQWFLVNQYKLFFSYIIYAFLFKAQNTMGYILQK